MCLGEVLSLYVARYFNQLALKTFLHLDNYKLIMTVLYYMNMM